MFWVFRGYGLTTRGDSRPQHFGHRRKPDRVSMGLSLRVLPGIPFVLSLIFLQFFISGNVEASCVSYSTGFSSVLEGDSVTVDVTYTPSDQLSCPPIPSGGTAVADISLLPGGVNTATINADFTLSNTGPMPGTLIFPAGSLTQSITVATLDDTPLADDGETVTLLLEDVEICSDQITSCTALPPAAPISSHTVTIFESQVVRLVTMPDSVTEGEPNIPVMIEKISGHAQTCNAQLIAGTGSAFDFDDFIPPFSAGTNIVPFPPGVTERIIPIEIVDDSVFEPTEEFFVSIQFPPPDNPCMVAAPLSFDIEILDDEPVPPPVEVSWGGPLEITVVEGETFTNTFDVDPAADSCGVFVQVNDISATQFEDHNIEDFPITATDGRVLNFRTRDTDEIGEPPEVFELELIPDPFNQPACTIGAGSVFRITVIEETNVTFDVDESSFDENVGVASVAVSATGAASVTVTTSNDAMDSATVGDDYSSTTTTLTFTAAGTQNVEIPITNDTDTESNESFFLNLVSPGTGTLIGAISEHELTIVDDDPIVPMNCVSLSTNSLAVSEDVGRLPLTVVYDSACPALVGDQFIRGFYNLIPGTAEEFPDSDYEDQGDVRFSISPPATEITLPVGIIDDLRDESDETFQVVIEEVEFCNDRFSCVPTSVVIDTATVTIEDNDDSATVVFFNPETYSVLEGDTVSIVVEKLSGGADCEISVSATGSSATFGEDHSFDTGTTIVNGSQLLISATAFTDSIDEMSSETFGVTIMPGTDGEEPPCIIEGDTDTAIVTILDAEPAVVEFASGFDPIVVNEDEDFVQIPIEITSGATDASVFYSTSSGVADPPMFPPAGPFEDYEEEINTRVDISAGSAELIFIEIINDFISECDEGFTVTLTPIPGTTTTVGTRDQIRVFIIDDEFTTTSNCINFSIADATLPEDAGLTGVDVLYDDSLCGPIPLGQEVIVEYQTLDGTATEGTDYDGPSPLSGEIVFDSSNFSLPQDLPYTIIDDTEIEGAVPEVFELVLLSASLCDLGGASCLDVGIGLDSHIVEIVDNDDLDPVVEFAVDSISVDVSENGGPVVLTLEIIGGVAPAFVDVSTADGPAPNGASGGNDYTILTNVPVEILSGTTGTVEIPITDDLVVEEGNETFTVTLTPTAGSDTIVGSSNTSTITIIDTTEPPLLSIVEFELTSTSVTVNEDDDIATLTLEITDGIAPASVDVTTGATGDSATAGTDYTALTAQTVVIPAGTTTQTIDISITEDMLLEDNEMFTVTLAPTPGTDTETGIENTATVTIVDTSMPPPPEVQFAVSSVFVDENNGPATLTLEITGGTAPASVDVFTGGDGATATAGIDYTALSSLTVAIPAGTTQTFDIEIIDDMLLEGEETFNVALVPTPGSGTVIGEEDVATVIITDTSVAPPPTVEFALTSTSVTVNEDDDTAILMLEITGGSAPASVDVTTGGTGDTATAGEDYTALSGQTVAIPAGTSQTVEIAITEDMLLEDNEMFTVTLAPTAGTNTLIGTEDTATVTIVDTSMPPPPVVQFSPNSVALSVDENDGPATLTLEITGGTAPASVDVTTGAGSATAGTDYAPLTAFTVAIPAGTTQTFNVAILNDAVIEEDETFAVAIVPTPGSGTVIGEESVATVTIVDTTDPPPTPIVEFSSASTSITVNENGVSPTLVLELTSGSAPASVNVTTVNGSASAPGDFTAVSQTVTFPAGSTTQSLVIPILTDTIVEPTETFTVTLSEVTEGNTAVGINDMATITIIDTTPPPSPIVQFASASTLITVDENGTSPTLNLEIISGAAPASIDVTTVNGSASAPGDFAAISQTITIPAGSAGESFVVSILTDTLIESNETFSVELSPTPGSNTVIGPNETSTITIIDTTPPPPPTVQFADGSASITVNENGASPTLELEVVSGMTPASVVVTTVNGSANAPDDFEALNQTITFPAGSTSQSFTVSILTDALVEADESFTVSLSATEGSNTLIGANNLSTVTIVDTTPPPPPPTVEFTASSTELTVNENGESPTLTLVISSGSAPASVVVTSTNGSAIAPEDYQAVSQTIEFPAGAASTAFQVSILADDLVEPDENFTLSIAPAPGSNTVIGGNASSTITIVDATPPPPPPAPPVVEFVTTTATINEDGGSVSLELALVAGEGPAFVDVASFDGTASAPGDYSTLLQMVEFLEGITSQTITVSINPDDILETDEQFGVMLAPSAGSTTVVGTADMATITIVDATVIPAVVEFAEPAVSIGEDSGQVELVLERTGNGPIDVVVSTSDGSAVDGEDYSGITTTVSWQLNETGNKTVAIPVLADSVIDPDETFFAGLAIAPGSAGSIGATQSSTVTIIDNSAPGVLQFVTASASTTEDAGLIAVLVERVAGSDGDVSVNFTTGDGRAVAGEDYESTSGTLNWPSGDTEPREIELTILNDSLLEADEQFTVTLSGAEPLGDDVQLGNPSQMTITIESDAVNAGVIRFVEASTDNVDERNGSISIDVERVDGDEGNVSVSFQTSNGSAIEGEDYVVTSGELFWESGETGIRTLTVELIDDTLLENEENFFVDLISAFPVGNDLQLGDPSRHVVNLVSDFDQAGQFRFADSSVTAPEDSGSITISVLREGGSEGNVSVTYESISDSALADEDFEAVSGELSWSGGDDSPMSITIPIVSDDIAESLERFTVDLIQAFPLESNTQIGSPDSVEILIPEQQVNPGIIQIAAQSVSVEAPEDSEFVNILVERSAGSQGPVSATYRVVGDTATAGEDFVSLEGQLTWEAGETGFRKVVVELFDDDVAEGAEQFFIDLVETFPVGNEVQLGERQRSTVTIAGNDQTFLADGFGGSLVIVPIGEQEREGSLNQEFTDLGFEVRDTANNNSPVPGATIRWSASPDGTALFPEGDTTITDEDGVTLNNVIISGSGFVRIIGTIVSDANQTVAQESVVSVRMPPPFSVAANQAFYTIAVGIGGSPGLTQIQRRIGQVLDMACNDIELRGGNLTLEVNDAGDQVTVEQQLDLVETCQAIENSPTVTRDLNRVAHEEYFVIADSIIEMSSLQLTNVYRRINTIKSGNKELLDLSGLNFNIYDQLIPGSVVNATQDSIHSQLGGGDGASADSSNFIPGAGIFVSGTIGFGDIDGGIDDQSGAQQDAEFNISDIIIGGDYRLSDSLVIGAGVGFINNDVDFTDERGGADITGSRLTLFGTWYSQNRGYADLVLDFGLNSYDMLRPISLEGAPNVVLAEAETEAKTASFSFGFGKNFYKEGWEFGPYGRLSLTTATVDAFSERALSAEVGFGSVMDIQEQNVNSRRLALGGQVTRTINTKRAVFVPNLRFEIEHEMEEVKDGITGTFQADPNNAEFTLLGNDRDSSFFNLGVGSSAIFPNGHSGFVQFETRGGQDRVTHHRAKIGYRLEF